MRQSFIHTLLAVVAASLSQCDLQAQQGFPSVSLMVKSTQEVENDLNFIVNLAGANGAAQWPNIKAILPAFLGGIDANQPIRVDFVFTDNGMEVRYVIPVAQDGEKDLIDNIAGFAGDKKPKKLKKGWWRIAGVGFTGEVRIIGGYAIISSNADLVPANFANPLGPITPLLTAGYDVGGIVKNDAAGAAARQEVMDKFRKDVEGTLNKKDDETEGEFQLRKVPLRHQIDELERLFVESDQLMLGWITDVPKREARLHLELTALPDTELARVIANLAANPSLFAAVERSDNSIFFGRVNHALDKMRQDNITELLKLLRAQGEAELTESTQINDKDKEALKEAGGLFFDILVDGTKMGVIDGFVNVELVDGKRVITGGIRVADSASALTALEALGKSDAKIQVNAVEVEGLALHRVTFGEKSGEHFRDLFGVTELLVAFPSKDVVLYAGGGQGDKRIQAAVAAIGADAQPENDGTFIEAWTRSGPWIEILKERRLRVEKKEGFDPAKLTPEERKAWEEDVELREEAIKAFLTKNDTIHMKLQRKDSAVVGTTTFAEDLLKFIGLQIAKFSEKSLQ